MTNTMRRHFAEEDFRKATASQPNENCVRVARRAGRVELRDDKTRFGGPGDRRVVLTSAEFDEFRAGIHSGITDELSLHLELHQDGTYLLRAARRPAVALTFTEAEVYAFLAGVRAGEFDLGEYESTTAA